MNSECPVIEYTQGQHLQSVQSKVQTPQEFPDFSILDTDVLLKILDLPKELNILAKEYNADAHTIRDAIANVLLHKGLDVSNLLLYY